MHSQEEQFFINAKLPDFHHVDIPDIWIGLSGTLQTRFWWPFWNYWTILPHLWTQSKGLHFSCLSPDKDQDGSFRWVDKTEVKFSNYGDGWPKNTADTWDCGQIFTGGTCSLPPWLKETDRVVFSEAEQHQLSLCCLSGNYDGKWETTNCFKSLGYICEMTGGINTKPPTIPGQSNLIFPPHMLSRHSFVSKCVIVCLQTPTVTMDICCMATSAIILRLRQRRIGTMPRLTAPVSRVTWPASILRRIWVFWLVSN